MPNCDFSLTNQIGGFLSCPVNAMKKQIQNDIRFSTCKMQLNGICLLTQQFEVMIMA